MQEQHPSKAKYIEVWMKDPSHLITTLLIGNNIVNISAAIVSESIISMYVLKWHLPLWVGVVMSIGAVSLVVLILCEITPKIIAYQNSEKVALYLLKAIVILDMVLSPLRKILIGISNVIIKLTGGTPGAPQGAFITEEEFLRLVDKVEKEGIIEKDEREMILGIFDLGDKQVREVMTPKPDIDCAPVTYTVEEIARYTDQVGRSRVPIYEDREDNIIGIINTKAILKAIRDGRSKEPIRALLSEPHFIPETKMLDELLQEFQKQRNHMSIVVDEYGSVCGLVTLEDLIEEIVGEIRDEYDTEGPLYKWINDTTVMVNARINITELNEVLTHGRLPDEKDYESVGGLIYDVLGKIPRSGETFVMDSYEIKVDKMIGRRIETVIIRTIEEQLKNN